MKLFIRRGVHLPFSGLGRGVLAKISFIVQYFLPILSINNDLSLNNTGLPETGHLPKSQTFLSIFTVK